MRWNWQQLDLPNFTYNAQLSRGCEDQFLKGAGVLVSVLSHLDAGDRQDLSIELLAQEAVDSSAIGGEILDRASVQSSVAKHLEIKTDYRRANAAKAGAVSTPDPALRGELANRQHFHALTPYHGTAPIWKGTNQSQGDEDPQ